MHRRQSGGGKQQQTKFCHDGLCPRKIFGRKVLAGGCWQEVLAEKSWQQRFHQGLAINEQALGRIVAGFEGGFVFISDGAKLRSAFVHYAFRGSFQTVL
jgi:hypothetical protein